LSKQHIFRTIAPLLIGALLAAINAGFAADDMAPREDSEDVILASDLPAEAASAIADMITVGLDGLSEAELNALAVAIEPGQTVVVPHEEGLATWDYGVAALTALAPNIPSTDCEPKASNVHLRASGNYGTAGVKPTVACVTTKKKLAINTVLMKKRSIWGTGSSVVASWYKGNAGVAAYRPTDREVKCTNSKKTTWLALHEHVVVRWDDCVFSLVTRSPDTDLVCGT